jgi:hypothetical protein
LLAQAKALFLPSGRRVRTVPGGLYQGVRLPIDFRHDAQLYFGLIERETHRWIRQAVGRADWVVDVGAGRGELVCYALLQPRIGFVMACEPDPATIRALRESAAANGFAEGDRLDVCECFVGSSAGQRSLDELLVGRVPGRGFIKVDVEGSELDVLNSGSRLLTSAGVDLLLETHSPELEQSCLAWLEARAFTVRVIDQAWWRRLVPEHRPSAHNRWIAGAGP